MNKQTEQGFTIVNSLVDEDNYDIMNPEVHKDPDIKYILSSIQNNMEVDWADWFFKIMLLYVFDKEEDMEKTKEDYPVSNIIGIEKAVRKIMTEQDRHNPKIVLSLLSVMSEYIGKAKDTAINIYPQNDCCTKNSDDDSFFSLY